MGDKKRILFLVIIIVMIGIGIITIVNKKDEYITFKQDNPILEYNAEVEAASFIASSKEKIIRYPVIHTKQIGKQTILYIINVKGKQVEVPYTLEIRDTAKPIIELHTSNIELALNEEFDPAVVVKEVKDPVDGKLFYSKREEKGRYTIQSNINEKKAGTYTVQVHATDKSGNQSRATCKVVVGVKKESNMDIKPTYINGVLLVNKKFGLPKSFGSGPDSRAEEALKKLQKGAQDAGYTIPVISGFRSYSFQETLFKEYIARDGIENANTYSARAGHSEHQTGLSFDVGEIDTRYGSTKEGQWLEANCAEYGFIIRYNKGKESVSGYRYEPWHIRYVGEEVAKVVMQENITLEEYLGIK